MSPRRPKKIHNPIIVGALGGSDERPSTFSQRSRLTNINCGTFGLLSLPVEVFGFVLKEFRDIQKEDILCNPPHFDEGFSERGELFRALSQVSRDFREAFLPLAWERLEGCIVWDEKTYGAWYKQVASKVQERSRGLSRNPELAKHVKCAYLFLADP